MYSVLVLTSLYMMCYQMLLLNLPGDSGMDQIQTLLKVNNNGITIKD
nr:MAG TPA: hypothetical protein [Bacteriophage sp.]